MHKKYTSTRSVVTPFSCGLHQPSFVRRMKDGSWNKDQWQNKNERSESLVLLYSHRLPQNLRNVVNKDSAPVAPPDLQKLAGACKRVCREKKHLGCRKICARVYLNCCFCLLLSCEKTGVEQTEAYQWLLQEIRIVLKGYVHLHFHHEAFVCGQRPLEIIILDRRFVMWTSGLL